MLFVDNFLHCLPSVLVQPLNPMRLTQPILRSLLCMPLLALVAADSAPVYTNDFSKADLGKPAKELLIHAGAFEVKNGKIVAWRDYFCMKQFEKGTGLGG